MIPFELSEIFQLVYLSLDKTRRFFPSVLFHNDLMYKINFVFYLPFKKKNTHRHPRVAGTPALQAPQHYRHPSVAGTPALQAPQRCRHPSAAGTPALQAPQRCRHPSVAGTQGCPLAPPGSSYIMRQRHHAK